MSDITEHAGIVEVPSAVQLLEVEARLGAEFVNKYLDCVSEVVRYNSRALPLAYKSMRASSAGTSMSSGSSRRVSATGMVGSRLANIRNVQSWRRAADGSCGDRGSAVAGSVSSGLTDSGVMYPDGLCYGKLFRSDVRAQLMGRVGTYPSLASLARLSSKKFQSLSELEKFRLQPTAEGVCHVAVAGQSGVKFLDAVSRYSQGGARLSGSLGAAVVDAGCYGTAADGSRVSGTTLLGGDGVSRLPRYEGDVISSTIPSTIDASPVVRALQEERENLFVDAESALVKDCGESDGLSSKLPNFVDVPIENVHSFQYEHGGVKYLVALSRRTGGYVGMIPVDSFSTADMTSATLLRLHADRKVVRMLSCGSRCVPKLRRLRIYNIFTVLKMNLTLGVKDLMGELLQYPIYEHLVPGALDRLV